MKTWMKAKNLFAVSMMVFVLTVAIAATAFSGGVTTTGDEDPFPLSCVDFSGSWGADDGSSYDINQSGCVRLKMQMQVTDKSFSAKALVVVPDNKQRLIRSSGVVGNVRHRWNAKSNATIIETYRYLKFDDHEEYEVVFLEQVNDSLILESTYDTIVPSKGDSKRSYQQKIFRRASSSNIVD